jgi:hypothetical protein
VRRIYDLTTDRVEVGGGKAGVVQRRVTRGAGLTLPGQMMATWSFQVWCEHGPMRWRGGVAAGE